MNHKYDIETPEHAWLNLTNKDIKNLGNPLLDDPHTDIHLRVISIMRNPQYLYWTCKVLLNIELLPMQTVVLQELWNKSFPMYIATRGYGKSFLLAVYGMLRCLLEPGTKVVIVGAAFRQSKVIFEYMEVIWRNAPLFRSVCSDKSGPTRDVDRCTMRINDSSAIAIPVGTGEKIRGLRANTIICDEFNSLPVEIYETVIAGFTAVSKDPTGNVKEAARRKALKEKGNWSEVQEETYLSRDRNQSILSGTCGYDFEHFAKYWKKYHSTIKNKGDFNKVAKETGEGGGETDVPEYMKRLDWKSFSIIRIPYELVPEGFMDDQQVARARATMHSGTYGMEYGAVFSRDSQGFFKRSLINACIASNINLESYGWPPWCIMPFDPITRGRSDGIYIYGIDPAAQSDNFAIVILELYPDHQRVVYVWTTNKKDFQERRRAGMTEAHDYYTFCGRKIRELMKVFPCTRIGIDSQGGGYQVAETLSDQDRLHEGERPIFEIIEEKKEKPTDIIAGDHILEYIQFASADWTSQANHGLKKDLEDKVLLFPRFDTATLAIVTERDKVAFNSLKKKFGEGQALRLYDTVEDAVLEVEDLKDELATVVISVTPSGRERWDTPELVLKSGKRHRMRKDRYSALVIANMIARQMRRVILPPSYVHVGRVAQAIDGNKKDAFQGKMYAGAEWAEAISPSTFFAVRR